jgi:hypothetical protein
MSSAARALSSDGSPQPKRPDVESSNASLSAPPGFAVATLRQVLPPAPLQRPESPRGSRPEPSPQPRTVRPRSRVQRSSRAEPTSQPSNSRSRSAARAVAVLGPGGPPAMVMPPGPGFWQCRGQAGPHQPWRRRQGQRTRRQIAVQNTFMCTLVMLFRERLGL